MSSHPLLPPWSCPLPWNLASPVCLRPLRVRYFVAQDSWLWGSLGLSMGIWGMIWGHKYHTYARQTLWISLVFSTNRIHFLSVETAISHSHSMSNRETPDKSILLSAVSLVRIYIRSLSYDLTLWTTNGKFHSATMTYFTWSRAWLYSRLTCPTPPLFDEFPFHLPSSTDISHSHSMSNRETPDKSVYCSLIR